MRLVAIALFCLMIFPGKVMAQEFNVYLGNGYFSDENSRKGNLKEGTYRFGEIRYLPIRANSRTRLGLFVNGTQSSYTFSGYVGSGYAISAGPSLSYERRIMIWRSYSWLNAGAKITSDGGHQGKYSQNLDNKSWYISGGIALADTGMFNREHNWFHQHKFMFTYDRPWQSSVKELVIGVSEKETRELKPSYTFTYQTNITSLKKLGLRFDPFARFTLGREGYNTPPDFYQAGIGLEVLRIYNQPLLSMSFQKKFMDGKRRMNLFTVELNATEAYRFLRVKHQQNKLARQKAKDNENVETKEIVEP